MPQSSKRIKKRYFNKIWKQAKLVFCACHCGKKLKNRDHYGRKRKYINGHNARKFDDPNQYKREWNHRNRKARYATRKRFYRRRRIKLIQDFGNKCKNCGVAYNGKNACIFHFHHKRPNAKKYIVAHMIINRSWKALIKEAKKCILLCANCHEMQHSAEF